MKVYVVTVYDDTWNSVSSVNLGGVFTSKESVEAGVHKIIETYYSEDKGYAITEENLQDGFVFLEDDEFNEVRIEIQEIDADAVCL